MSGSGRRCPRTTSEADWANAYRESVREVQRILYLGNDIEMITLAFVSRAQRAALCAKRWGRPAQQRHEVQSRLVVPVRGAHPGVAVSHIAVSGASHVRGIIMSPGPDATIPSASDQFYDCQACTVGSMGYSYRSSLQCHHGSHGGKNTDRVPTPLDGPDRARVLCLPRCEPMELTARRPCLESRIIEAVGNNG